MSIFDVSLQNANRVYSVAWWVSILGAGLTFFAIAALFWSSNIRDDFSSRAIAIANADAKKAVEGTALANERAARLELSAEQARLQTAQLQGELAWRTISSLQAAELTRVLSNSPAKIHIAWVQGDPEAFWYAQQIIGCFQNAGWVVTGEVVPMLNSISTGISVPHEPAALNDVVRAKLEAAGIMPGNYDIPRAGMVFGTIANMDEATMFIGVRSNAVPSLVHKPTPHL